MPDGVGVRLTQVGDGVVRVVRGDGTPGNDEGLGVVVGRSISQFRPKGEAMWREVRIESFTGQWFPRRLCNTPPMRR